LTYLVEEHEMANAPTGFTAGNVFDLPDLDAPIYRLFPFRRFEQVMRDRELVLVKPTMWVNDPFENFLLQAEATIITGEGVSLSSLRDKLYGQCWMLCEESDAMWQIYSFPQQSNPLPRRLLHRLVYIFNRWLNGTPAAQEEGVKARTTIRKLFTAFFNLQDQFRDLRYFIGKVQYLSQGEIDSLMKDADTVTGLVTDGTGRGHAKSLLIKRNAYDHEKEVRLIFKAGNGYDTHQKFYRFAIEPNDLIEEVILDPRLTPSECAARNRQLRALGFQNPIRQSTLRLPPQHDIRLVK
jgi:hypothetical protein